MNFSVVLRSGSLEYEGEIFMTNTQLNSGSGQPWADNNHSQTAGVRGPVLLQDYQLV